MAKQRIRLTESQLNRVIKESVKRVLKEGNKGGVSQGAFYDADREADAMLNRDFYGKGSVYGKRDKNDPTVDKIQDKTFTELMDSDEEALKQECQDIIQRIANKWGVSVKRVTDMFSGCFDNEPWRKAYKDARLAEK